jgi:hypothetical protein
MRLPFSVLCWLALGAWLVVSGSGCGPTRGACSACCNSAGVTLCKNDFSEADCQEWTRLRIQNLNWTFYANQTCEARGTPETN